MLPIRSDHIPAGCLYCRQGILRTKEQTRYHHQVGDDTFICTKEEPGEIFE